MKKLGVVLLLLPALVLAGCGSGDDAPPAPSLPATLNLRGEVILSGATNVRGGLSECVGAGAFADLYPGAPVIVNNAEGRPIIISKIEYAVGTNFYLNQLDQCTFSVRLANVPRLDSYQFVFGRQDPIPYTFADLYRLNGLFTFGFPRRAPATTTTTTSITTKP